MGAKLQITVDVFLGMGVVGRFWGRPNPSLYLVEGYAEQGYALGGGWSPWMCGLLGLAFVVSGLVDCGFK